MIDKKSDKANINKLNQELINKGAINLETPSRKRQIGVGLTKLVMAGAIGMFLYEIHPAISVDTGYDSTLLDYTREVFQVSTSTGIEVILGYNAYHFIKDGTKSLYNSLKPR